MKLDSSIYPAMFDGHPFPTVLLDEHLRVLCANRATKELFGLAPDRLSGISMLSIVPDAKLSSFLLDFAGKQSKVMELQVSLPYGSSSIQLKLTAVRIEPHLQSYMTGNTAAPQGRARDLRLVVFENMTERVILEQQLVQAEKLAGMGQLAAGVGHELGNPLTSISYNLLFLRQKVPAGSDSQVIEALDTTLEKVEDMRKLLFALSRFYSRRQPSYEILDLNEVIRRSAVFVTKDAERRGIQLNLALLPSVLSCRIDRAMMNQVLMNVLKNAMEAMPMGGKISVRTQSRFRSHDLTGSALVLISDTGHGIDESELQNVFRPLYSSKPRGTGLGLPFCRQVVEEHGGEIRLTSRKGVGTTVALVLPFAEKRLAAQRGS